MAIVTMSGLMLEMLEAEHRAEAAEAADHLVGDQQHVVLFQHRLDLGEIGARRHEHAAGAHHRLGDEGGHGVGPFALDQRVELFGEPGREGLLALAGLGEPVMMRAVGVQDAGDRQIEIAVIVGRPGEAGAGDGDAVIGLGAAR